jgi:hypothetical protein
MLRGFGVLSAGLLLAGCATQSGGPPVPATPPAPAAIASLVGTAQFHTPEGRAYSCAGVSVALVANTPRSRQRLQALYGSAEHALAPVAEVRARSAALGAGDPPLASAQCDGRGSFLFPSLEPGDYFVIARLRGDFAGRAVEDMGLLQRVVVHPGEERHIRLAP